MKNIEIEYHNGVPEFITTSTEDLSIQRMGFNTQEEAEFIISAAKILKQNGRGSLEILKIVPYLFRVLGVNNGWTE